MTEIKRCRVEQASCAETLRSGVCPPWHPNAGRLATASDLASAQMGLEDWMGEELEIMSEPRTYEEILASKIVEAKPRGFEPLDILAPL